jgi:DsbC/DsbD-like thiol-disulfide interchange protein/cytochrome c biogenesis protein CcdA
VRLIGLLRTGLLALLAGLASALPLAAQAAAGPVVQAPHMELQLVSAGSAVPGGQVQVALRMKADPEWHSFWRNPGDAGEATRLVWTLPPGWKAGEFTWPLPKTLLVAGILMNYVYDGEVLLPQPITVPADAKVGQTITLKAEAVYQVCADVCIPGQETLSVEVPVTAAPTADARWGPAIAKVLAEAPRPAPLTAALETSPSLKLGVAGAALRGADFKDARFFPFENGVIDNAKPQSGTFGPDGVTLTLTRAPELTGQPTRLAGVLSVGGKGYEIAATPGPLPPGASGKGAVGTPAPGAPDQMGLVQAVLFALLGGLILNLMPCVFPVLSIKAASIAQHAQHGEKARLQGLAFLAGVIVTFMILAGALLAAKAAGGAVGWGFQLQSPPVIAALTLLMLLIALNFAGLFEVGLSIQGAGDSLANRGGLSGSFFTGALAVVVAAPCTAPFMAGALGFALAQPAIVALLVFLALAIGFALPFTALTFAPGLLRLMPKPGGWMNIFKTVLAFPMLGAAAWLAWVFTSQVGVQGLPFLLAAAILVSLGAWLFGIGQRQMALRPRLILQLALPIALIGAAYLVAKSERAEVEAEPWSVQRVAELRAEGRPILVNFTAAWCVTCQVNEGAALSSPAVADALAKANGVYLKGDWTNRNDAIAAALAEHGRVGVPLYLVYPAAGGEPEVLPQFLTAGIVTAALERAAAK